MCIEEEYVFPPQIIFVSRTHKGETLESKMCFDLPEETYNLRIQRSIGWDKESFFIKVICWGHQERKYLGIVTK